ncbi:hypothetical protein HYC85_030062 [Camellia sinensis]|uniref:Uncharacterized protein n=1 Tax=Camellia sinensis TaxID=4442 RepID=A0A7J7G120_CAMSI|nr:hypothetical protein HYC85_030062 [Camellia sinensis]
MSNLSKLKFSALDISGENYLSWILDVEIHFEGKLITRPSPSKSVGTVANESKACQKRGRPIEEEIGDVLRGLGEDRGCTSKPDRYRKYATSKDIAGRLVAGIDVDWILEFLGVLLEKHLINAVSNRNSSNVSGLSLSGNEIRCQDEEEELGVVDLRGRKYRYRVRFRQYRRELVRPLWLSQ